MLSDIQIAQQTELWHIRDIAQKAGVAEKYLEQYGNFKAKIDLSLINEARTDGKLILVTAITPTPAGEGKTTTTVGLADALRKIGKNSVVALRALELARPAMASLESFTEEAVKDCLMALAAENGLKTGQMMWPVRTALSGQASTPGGATEIAYLLGRDESLRRIDKGIEMLKNA